MNGYENNNGNANGQKAIAAVGTLNGSVDSVLEAALRLLFRDVTCSRVGLIGGGTRYHILDKAPTKDCEDGSFMATLTYFSKGTVLNEEKVQLGNVLVLVHGSSAQACEYLLERVTTVGIQDVHRLQSAHV